MPQFIMTVEDALPADFCAEVIARFEADQRVAADPQPDYSTRRYLNISQCANWLSINARFCTIVNSLVGRYFSRPKALAQATHTEWSDDGFVVCRYAPGDACILHVDGQCTVAPQNGLRLCTVLFYLNDVETGGETSFPMQDVKVQPRQGRAVIFPVGFTHPHEVLPPVSGARYIMQTWITDPRQVVELRAEEGDQDYFDDEEDYFDEDEACEDGADS